MIPDSFEPFVGADRIVDFLAMSRQQVLRMTRAGIIRAYPVSGSQRHVWAYRLSEVAEDIAGLRKQVRGKLFLGNPQGSEAKEKVNG
jgi:hypothetical protein